MPSKRTRKSRAVRFPIGCGIDVVELSRFRRALSRGGEAFLRRVFTRQETTYARKRRQTALLHLAGRFAAKEAVIKAVSQIDPKRTLTMKQVEVRNDQLGRPHIVLHDGRSDTIQLYVSLSHADTIAVANAIAVNATARHA
jgi:holo-[acyl-carrier protein] synthase